MSGIVISLLLNLAVAALLVVTIIICNKLNQRIRVLQNSKSELSQLIRKFDESTERASSSILAIQNASKKIAENIQVKLEKANYLADDLSFMIEKGSKLADQLEGAISNRKPDSSQSGGRPVASAAPSRPSVPTARPAATAPTASAVVARDKIVASAGMPGNAAKAASTLESILSRVNTRKAAVNAEQMASAPPKRPEQPPARVRSKAEQELLEALKSGQ